MILGTENSLYFPVGNIVQLYFPLMVKEEGNKVWFSNQCVESSLKATKQVMDKCKKVLCLKIDFEMKGFFCLSETKYLPRK